MSTLRLILREFLGLFFDDGSLAVAILVVVGLVALLVKTGLLAGLVGGALLFACLLAILVENLRRSAKRLGGK